MSKISESSLKMKDQPFFLLAFDNYKQESTYFGHLIPPLYCSFQRVLSWTTSLLNNRAMLQLLY